jgi:hypothetical protein
METLGKQKLKTKLASFWVKMRVKLWTQRTSGDYIPGAVRAALFLGLDILLDGRLPLLLVSLVDGVDLPPGLALKIQDFVVFKSVFRIRIRIQSGQWIQIPDPDPGGQK